MKALLSLSGGLDSATLLHYLLERGKYDEVVAVSFDYGSKHNPFEIEMAKQLSKYYGIAWNVIDLRGAMKGFKSNLMITGGDIPEGHYEDKSMSLTVVPCRNMIFTSLLAGLAQSLDIPCVYLGIHAGDHAIYPDCRPDFFYSMMNTIALATEHKVELCAPFLNKSKAKIVEIGLELKVPYQLTRTCYKSQKDACGVCGSCIERLEAFHLNGAIDPIEYERGIIGNE